MELPEDFYIFQCDTIKKERQLFLNVLITDPPVSIRTHKIKLMSDWIDKSDVPWNDHGHYLDTRPSFTLDPNFHAGAYYVQEASSMFLEYAVKSCIDLSRPNKVLDLCAAPGGKSTLLNGLLSEDSLLVCNEVIKSRINPLKQNLAKWGYPNYLICNHECEDFENLKGYFDLVVVDAPCSGEGLFRKDKKAIKEWSIDNVQLCTSRQKRILKGAMDLVKPGGTLIYSTCTYNTSENESNIKWISSLDLFEGIQLNVNEDWKIEEQKFEGSYGYQFFPHKVKGEGFFISCFRKKQIGESAQFKKIKPFAKSISKAELMIISPWIKNHEKYFFFKNDLEEIKAIPQELKYDVDILKTYIKRMSTGLNIGTIKKNGLIPHHDLALSLIVNNDIPNIELTKTEALLFLKKETFKPSTDQIGWHLVKYQNLNLGWVKVLKNRLNNYLPTSWRIRMDLPSN